MSKLNQRNIPFTDQELEKITMLGKAEGRAFKYQAAQLIKEALLARDEFKELVIEGDKK